MINAETVFTELAKELRKFVPGAVFGGSYPIVADAIETALATARQADAPAPRELTHAEKLAELRDNPQVGDAWKFRGELRRIVKCDCQIMSMRFGCDPSDVWSYKTAEYFYMFSDNITDIRLAPRPPKPAPATCAKCEERKIEWVALYNDYSRIKAELATALARVKELEGKAAKGAVRVFEDAFRHYAFRGGKTFYRVRTPTGDWQESPIAISADQWMQVWGFNHELPPAEVADLLAKSPLPDGVK